MRERKKGSPRAAKSVFTVSREKVLVYSSQNVLTVLLLYASFTFLFNFSTQFGILFFSNDFENVPFVKEPTSLCHFAK